MTYYIRKFRFDDIPALVGVINRAAEADHDGTEITLDELRARFERPYFFPEYNCLIAINADGAIVGYTTAELDPRFGKGWGTGCVDPAYRGQGIGRMLIQAADARHLEQAENHLPPDMGLYVTRFCDETTPSTRALFEAEGYAVWLTSYVMHSDLGDAPEVSLPAGFALRPFERTRDVRRVWEAEGEIFHNAPGYAQPPLEVWESLMFPAGHNDALWLTAVDEHAADTPVAGICLCHAMPKEPGVAWVDLLGVREAYRKRGLGLALLQQSFSVLQAHGFTAVELDVDSENATHAVALYKRAGMTLKRCYLTYRKVIRGAGLS